MTLFASAEPIEPSIAGALCKVEGWHQGGFLPADIYGWAPLFGAWFVGLVGVTPLKVRGVY